MNTNNLNYKDNLNCNNSNSILHSKFLILNYTINPPVSKADIPPYKGGQGGFTLLKRFNCNLIFNFQSSIFNFKAFSLIELSIVLIIIGLLIAGVTGGASLIQSAKVRSMMSEMRDYERAVYSFQAAKGRFPGDVKNYGTIGYYSNYYEPTKDSSHYARPSYTYQASDFPSDFITEFQKTAGAGEFPDFNSAPFVELYNEGIIDFKPLGNAETALKDPQKGVPSLKTDPGVCVFFVYTGSYPDYTAEPCKKDDNDCIYYKGLVHNGQMKEALEVYYSGNSATKGIDPKFMEAVDKKLDDGWYSTGIFRGSCYGSNDGGRNSYDNAIESGKKCGHFKYVL